MENVEGQHEVSAKTPVLNLKKILEKNHVSHTAKLLIWTARFGEFAFHRVVQANSIDGAILAIIGCSWRVA